MCCNTKPGPRAAIDYLNAQTGLHLTQTDWHHLRAMAESHLGHKLSSSYADAEEAARVATDLADKFGGTDEQKTEFIRSFSRARNTSGTLDTLDTLTELGFPETVTERPRRAGRGLEVESAGQNPDMELEYDDSILIDPPRKGFGSLDLDAMTEAQVRSLARAALDEESPRHFYDFDRAIREATTPLPVDVKESMLAQAGTHPDGDQFIPSLFMNPMNVTEADVRALLARDDVSNKVKAGVLKSAPENVVTPAVAAEAMQSPSAYVREAAADTDRLTREDALAALSRPENERLGIAAVLAASTSLTEADVAHLDDKVLTLRRQNRDFFADSELRTQAPEWKRRRVTIEAAGGTFEGTMGVDTNSDRPMLIPKGSRTRGHILSAMRAGSMMGVDPYSGLTVIKDSKTGEVLFDSAARPYVRAKGIGGGVGDYIKSDE